MKLRQFTILTDQNIHPDVVAYFRTEGFQVVDVEQAGLLGASDTMILAAATVDGRIVVTHDADFGTLTIQQGFPFVGIVYLRPGHIGARSTIESLEQILAIDPDLAPPFVLVAKRTGNQVKIRVRSFAPAPIGDEPTR